MISMHQKKDTKTSLFQNSKYLLQCKKYINFHIFSQNTGANTINIFTKKKKKLDLLSLTFRCV